MSGIAGIVNFDGSPVDTELVGRMMRKLQGWAPDGHDCAIIENAGFGYAQLRTTDEAAAERQPLSFDGNIHILADARIDGRAELVKNLRRNDRDVTSDAPDVELILHAYHVWGSDCVHRLLGDFVFAIWEAERGRLFCARDHFGVKPFFYADMGDTFVFSNVLNVVRLSRAVSDELNEYAVGDFLLFGFNQSLDATYFKEIHRLPPAHTLRRTKNECVVSRRYWTLPTDGVVRYRRPLEYVEQFKELFELSVADRLRGTQFGVSMSGGLDSTSVASMAHGILSNGNRAFDLRLCTNVYDRLIPDEERQFAQLVARALDTPIYFESLDNAELHSGWDAPGIELPEPAEVFDKGPTTNARREFMANCRVVLTGFGADPALAAPRGYVVNRILRGELGELVRGLWACLSTHGHLPSLGIRSLLLGRRVDTAPDIWVPAWLNKKFLARLDLPARREWDLPATNDQHPVRPEAYAALGAPVWPHCFGVFDPGYNDEPVEYRHPFFDLRLVRFLLAMPSQPWFVGKALLREAMKGILPDAVRLRPKTVLCGDPVHAVSFKFDRDCRDRLLGAPGLSSFVDRDAVPVHIWEKPALASGEYYGNVRAFSLGYWLNYCRSNLPEKAVRGAT